MNQRKGSSTAVTRILAMVAILKHLGNKSAELEAICCTSFPLLPSQICKQYPALIPEHGHSFILRKEHNIFTREFP